MAVLLCGMLYAGEDRYLSARQRLIESFGNIIEETGLADWDHSEYYNKELGEDIKRRFIFFKWRQMLSPFTSYFMGTLVFGICYNATMSTYKATFTMIRNDHIFSSGEEVRITHPDGLKRLTKGVRVMPYFLARVERQTHDGLDISLCFTNITRWHLVPERIPLGNIKSLQLGSDGETYIVVCKKYYDNLYKNTSVCFGMIDLDGITQEFKRSPINTIKLIGKTHKNLDIFLRDHPQIGIVSFADSIIVKSNWSYYRTRNYNPEWFLHTMLELKSILKRKSYIIITQGQNYVNNKNGQIFDIKGNHVNLLSFGYAFAALYEIDSAVKQFNESMRRDVYLDDFFFKSLNNESTLLDYSSKCEDQYSSKLANTCKVIAINEQPHRKRIEIVQPTVSGPAE